MSYEQFTLEMLENQFGLTLAQSDNLFGTVPLCAPSDLLTAVLKRHLPLVVGKGTEKVRSELLIAPILVEARELLNGQISLFSGVAFNVDRKSGLHGFCDFLISRDPFVIEIKAPVIAVAEAKREDLSSGIAQCLAELVAAQRFNEKRGKSQPILYGVLTSGTDWRFLKLEGTQATLDLREYPITELENILGILVFMAS
ncbi:hypothetical protein [Armatimonas sp.]|uniref:hypothetical protein n=1 Tax=Armatimonas sp. TaxID=1872638 RepID=UPI003750C7B1